MKVKKLNTIVMLSFLLSVIQVNSEEVCIGFQGEVTSVFSDDFDQLDAALKSPGDMFFGQLYLNTELSNPIAVNIGDDFGFGNNSITFKSGRNQVESRRANYIVTKQGPLYINVGFPFSFNEIENGSTVNAAKIMEYVQYYPARVSVSKFVSGLGYHFGGEMNDFFDLPVRACVRTVNYQNLTLPLP